MKHTAVGVILAGVLGALAFTALLGFLRAAGSTDINLEMALGRLLAPQVEGNAALLGFTFHLLAGGVFALIYYEILKFLGARSWWYGLILALPHWVFGGIVMGQLCASHPKMQRFMPGSDSLHSAAGFETLGALLFVHLLYGALVGFACAAPVSDAAKISEELSTGATSKPLEQRVA